MWLSPAETLPIFPSRPVPPAPTTWTGVVLSVVVAFPSCPLSLSPQHHTVLSGTTVHVCSSPTAAQKAAASTLPVLAALDVNTPSDDGTNEISRTTAAKAAVGGRFRATARFTGAAAHSYVSPLCTTPAC